MVTDVRSQQRHFGRIDGKSVSIVLSSDQLVQAPTWNDDDEAEPPLTIGRALKLAKSAVAMKYPNLKHEDWTVTVTLVEEHTAVNTDQHFTDENGIEYYKTGQNEIVFTSSWIYWVRLRSIPVVGNGLTAIFAPNIPVAVMMDGKTVLPTEITRPLPDAEFRQAYRRIDLP